MIFFNAVKLLSHAIIKGLGIPLLRRGRVLSSDGPAPTIITSEPCPIVSHSLGNLFVKYPARLINICLWRRYPVS